MSLGVEYLSAITFFASTHCMVELASGGFNLNRERDRLYAYILTGHLVFLGCAMIKKF